MICPVEIAHDMSAWRAARMTEHTSMDSYPKAAMERAMTVQDVMLQAMAKKITWWQAAEILWHQPTGMCGGGGSATSKRGYNGLLAGKPMLALGM
jgi:hypothetical protein